MTYKQQPKPAEVSNQVNVQVMGADGPVSSTQIAPSARSVTVDELLSRQGGWLIAHRGGSLDWPEMSLRAYTECVNRGIPALEFSFGITSDGVPVGVHNRNLQGVDPSAPDTPVGEMTWAQVRQYTTKGQPFIQLHDLIAAYGSDHVLFVDPKYSAVAHKTYLPWLDPKHTIMKFYGDATWLADIWRAKGFKTWGYLYPNTIESGQAAEWAKHWDLIGVPWDAAESVWQTALSYGRPIIGHICPSQKAINRSFQRGAVGAMCAKIDKMTLP